MMKYETKVQGGSNMTGTYAACLHRNQSRSYLNHLVYLKLWTTRITAFTPTSNSQPNQQAPVLWRHLTKAINICIILGKRLEGNSTECHLIRDREHVTKNAYGLGGGVAYYW